MIARMSYTLYDKDMGTESRLLRHFMQKNYELVCETECGVAVRWTHVYNENNTAYTSKIDQMCSCGV